jgi:hypothetical protein
MERSRRCNIQSWTVRKLLARNAGSDQLIAVDFADEAGRLNLRRDSTGETDVLLQVDGCLREREIVVDAVLEYDPDEGQAIK